MANILITGAGKGVGYALTKYFLDNKSTKVFAVSRNIEALNSLGTTYPTLFPIAFDLSSDPYSKLKEIISNKANEINIIVNNAGVLINKKIETFEERDFDRLFNTNVKAVFMLMKILFPLLKKGSHVVNIGSMGGVQGTVKFPGLSLYSASKGALAILTEALAEEWKDKGIHVNYLGLGAVQTKMLSEAFPDFQTDMTAEKIANFIGYFSYEGMKYFNGKIIPVSSDSP